MSTIYGNALILPSTSGVAKETWVLNETINREAAVSFSANFTSNGFSYIGLELKRGAPTPGGISYDLCYKKDSGGIIVVLGGDMISWESPAYRKLTFDTPPTGDLLTWLQANGVKQPDDTAVQDTKALTITSNGTVSVTPDEGYDALKKVDVTVNVASGGGGSAGFSVTFPATATNWDHASDADLLLSDGTVKSFRLYSEVSGKTIENVVGINCIGMSPYDVLKMTLSEGSLAQCTLGPPQSATYRITTSNNTTVTWYNGGNRTFWWPLADTVISSIEMYYTD